MVVVMSLAEVENNFIEVAEEVNRTGQSVTVFKDNKPWVVISPVSPAAPSAVDVAVDFMDEYADVFAELAK